MKNKNLYSVCKTIILSGISGKNDSNIKSKSWFLVQFNIYTMKILI